jgi:hypothetical protein
MKPSIDRRTLGLRPVVLALGIVLAACGGSAAGAGTPAGGGPEATTGASGGSTSGGSGSEASGLCELVTAEQAAAALGEPVGVGVAKKSSLTGTSICRYTATGSENAIQIEYLEDQTRAGWEEAIGNVGMLDETRLDGIGEVAYRADDAALGAGTRLAAFDQGKAIWVVIYKDGDDAAIFAAAETVARELLASLNA